ncbi:unnamed protein product [Lepeophtheirus salmonis]|uniref:(salmon louse) hypothetical protein n=1 Tax=Lepeophtheirus salmonis TaxID=72036 RepID=A0A7R8CNG7_LEPSM|nr:unnamed protein product [Lepeophtheirus salmonis]CAF2875187.1 unnamed protein product [Lepeophtheirus salmonis]
MHISINEESVESHYIALHPPPHLSEKDCRKIIHPKSFSTFKSSSPRWNVGKKFNLCFKCLGEYHPKRKCFGKCEVNGCLTTHHSLLHFDTFKTDNKLQCEQSDPSTVTNLQFDSHYFNDNIPRITQLIASTLLGLIDSVDQRIPLISLKRKLARTRQLKEEFAKAMRYYEELGFSRKTTHKELQEFFNGSQYFIPHLTVIREDKTTSKVCPVFNGSFLDSRGISLNDCILNGPLTQKIIAFKNNDRRDKNPHVEPKVILMSSVMFGVKSSPFLVMSSIKHHSQTEIGRKYPLAFKSISNDIYVDDVFEGSCDSESPWSLFRRNKIPNQKGSCSAKDKKNFGSIGIIGRITVSKICSTHFLDSKTKLYSENILWVSCQRNSIGSLCWNYVPSEQNPADVLSRGRGCTFNSLELNTFYWNVTSCILCSSEHWLKQDYSSIPNIYLINVELNKKFVVAISKTE